MHAIDRRVESPEPYMAWVMADEGGDVDYRCACLLAEMVGIELGDR